MDFEGIRAQIVVPGIEILLQQLTVDGLPGPHHQTRQNGKLFRRDVYRLLLQIHLLAGQVECQIVLLQQVIAVALIAADQRPNPGLQLN